MPHCWPQKQQCVLTSRSGSTLVDSRDAGHRREVRTEPLDDAQRRSTGSSAIVRPIARRRGVSDRRAFRSAATARPAPGRRAPAGTSGRPPGSGRRRAISYAEAELALDGRQIAHHRRRGERLAAAAAARLLAARAGVLVEADAELRRPLEDVEQLAERQPQQRDDHGDRVEDREEVVGVALHPRVARRQHQAGHADREQQQQRQDVLRRTAARATAPWSIIRRRNASITPAMTRNDDHTRPWKIDERRARTRPGSPGPGMPKTNVRYDVQIARARSRSGSSPRPAGT